MGLSAGEPREPKPAISSEADPPLSILPDAPHPQVVADTCTPQAVRDAAMIDNAYERR